MTDFVIRPYNPETDYPAVEANLLQAGLYDPDLDIEERLSQFADSILVANVMDEVVGSVYVVNHIVPMLFRLVVNEAHRRQGIGTALVEAGKGKLLQGGSKEVELFFDTKDKNLELWYRNLGFDDGGIYRSMWRYIDPE